jgi:hypothetical protein
MKNQYDIICLALKSAPKYTGKLDQLVDDLCARYGIYKQNDNLAVRNIVNLALDATSSRDFREKAEFILAQIN